MRTASTIRWLLAAMAVVASAEERPAPKPAPPSERGIVEAKRDFDAVKAARGAPAQPSAELPRFATPEFTAGAQAPQSPSARAEAAVAAKKRSANWLVDAMADKAKKLPGKDGRDATREHDDMVTEADSQQLDTPAEKEKSAPRRSFEPGLNPLDQYLATWMTPQDLALLRPVMRSDPSGLPDRLDFGLGVPQSPTAGTSQARGGMGLLLSGPTAGGAPGAAHDNPFLQSLMPPAQPAVSPLAPMPGASASAPPAGSLMAPPPNPPPVPKSVTPGFVKPRDDEKYYKQMKRF
jgi:hypothetical protein